MVVLANAEGWDYFDANENYSIKYKYYIKGKKTTKQKYNAYVKKLKSNGKEGKIISESLMIVFSYKLMIKRLSGPVTFFSGLLVGLFWGVALFMLSRSYL